MDDPLIDSLVAALRHAPDDVPLRLHVAHTLIAANRHGEAIAHVAHALSLDPQSVTGRALMAQALGSQPATEVETPADPASESPSDWVAFEREVSDLVPPMFVDSSLETSSASAYDVEATGLSLADVGGMQEVKARLDASFLAPLRNPELRALYGKSLQGGMLLYGPPGCGKTFLARAVAGELGAAFLAVSLADVLDMYIGNSEKNVQELFATARAAAPCVLFLDELDAMGQKRSLTRNSGMRTTVNQLLTELDGIGSRNEGVFVLAATNHPWDVDPALRRPGRLDRTLLVLPPDQEAREAIFRYHLRDRPIENIDAARLAKRTDGYSGADIAHICDSAAEFALLESARSGQVRLISMADVERALGEVRPSIGPWLETARNVALFANDSGEYDDLARYIRKHRAR
jgi:SpoVK/Ycf46/Vps4 family AAA+-type ATPase